MARPAFLNEMAGRLIRADGRSRSAKSVETFGWLILAEALLIVFGPNTVASLLRLPVLVEQGASYFRLAGMLVGGLGMLYIASGRLNSKEFVFASLLDRPLVPIAMAVLWRLGIIPGPLALAFAIQDFGSFLWTLFALRSEQRNQ